MVNPGPTARLDALQRTGLTAAPDATFDRFAAMVHTVLRAPVALVSLVGADRQFFPGACGLAEPWQQQRETPLSHSFCWPVVEEGAPLVIGDARTDPRVRDNPAIEDLGVVGYAGMPLTDAGGVVLGALCAIDREPREWTTAELAMLADLAAACSDSLRLRIATRRTQAEYNRIRLLLRASTALAGASSLDQVVTTVRELVTGTLDPAYAGFSVLDETEHVALASTRLLPPELAERWARYRADLSTPSALAARTGRPVLLPDLETVARRAPDALGTFQEMGWQSAASVPLPGRYGPIGALTFCWKVPYRLDDAEQAVLAALAGYVTQTLSRVMLLEDRRTAAATMQKALLTPLPRHQDVTMVARYLPAHHEDHVGGDWYDAVSLGGGRLAVVIGDVTGHSIAAAAAMSQLRSMLRTLLIDRHEPPSALLRRLEHTSQALGQDGLASVLLAYLDRAPSGGYMLTWANAGHPPPTLILPDGRLTVLEGRDVLLGATRRAFRHNHTRLLPAGSTLVLHTDGLVDTRTMPFDRGMARLHEVLTRHRGAPPDLLADLVLEQSRDGDDDVALLVVATPAAAGQA